MPCDIVYLITLQFTTQRKAQCCIDLTTPMQHGAVLFSSARLPQKSVLINCVSASSSLAGAYIAISTWVSYNFRQNVLTCSAAPHRCDRAFVSHRFCFHDYRYSTYSTVLIFLYEVRFGQASWVTCRNTAHNTQYRTPRYAVLCTPMVCGIWTFNDFWLLMLYIKTAFTIAHFNLGNYTIRSRHSNGVYNIFFLHDV